MTLLRIFQITFIASFVGVYVVLAISSFLLALQPSIAEGRQARRHRLSTAESNTKQQLGESSDLPSVRQV
jgi:hypothetical protein